MTFETWIMLAILIIMFGLLVWNKLPAWVVFIGTLTVTGWSVRVGTVMGSWSQGM